MGSGIRTALNRFQTCHSSRAPLLLLAIVIAGCVPELPRRPAALDSIGVRVGKGWLEPSPLHEDQRLGRVNQVLRRPSGDTVIVASRAFVELGEKGTRIVEFASEYGEVELLEWPDGGMRYLDRGGGGWQTGALLAGDGKLLWQPSRGLGMNDIAAGNLEGGDEPEFVVGYNGGGGVHLLDSDGRRRWQQADANVWHVEVVDTDSDERPEIVHSNAGGQITIRDASGNVIRRAATEGYFSQFSLVRWPSDRLGLLHAGDGVIRVVDFDGRVRDRFPVPDASFLGDVRGVTVRLEGVDHLVLAVYQTHWERTQLFVFKAPGTLRYHEVLGGTCAALGTSRSAEFLVGCEGRVLRYAGAGSQPPKTR